MTRDVQTREFNRLNIQLKHESQSVTESPISVTQTKLIIVYSKYIYIHKIQCIRQ